MKAKLITIVLILTGLLISSSIAQQPYGSAQKRQPGVRQRLSGIVEHTLFFSQSGQLQDRAVLPEKMSAGRSGDDKERRREDRLVNRDFNFRPQDETVIAINPNNPDHIVTGYNDYRIGVPIGGGFSTSFDGGRTWHDGLITFPLMTDMVDFPGFSEVPRGGGDPSVAFANDGTVYHTSLGFCVYYCESALFLYRSDNGGIAWSRPEISTGKGLIDYWPYANDCSVFLDKEFMTVDNSGGPHDGRIYVTYTRFFFEGGADYYEAPIFLAYSDDKGESFTVAGEINGASSQLCRYQDDTTGGTGPGATGPDGTDYDCDQNQFSYPVVGSDGTLYVHFLNEQNIDQWRGGGIDGTGAQEYDNQILVVRVDPDTFAVDGPYQVAMLADGLTNYPINENDRQTVCNGGWRLNSAGNIAIGPADELYVIWSDNRNGDTFQYPTALNTDYTCPDNLQTSTDVFISKSTDGGVTWSGPVKITQDPKNFDNWFPWVTVSDNGWVWAVYYDRRISGDNTLTDAWVAVSKDGGATWKEMRVSDQSSDFTNGFFGTPTFIGDYNSIAAVGRTAYPFWTDSRVDGDTDVYLDVVRK